MSTNQPTVPCKWCAEPTPMLGTKECDSCHEVRIRMTQMAPITMLRIIAGVVNELDN